MVARAGGSRSGQRSSAGKRRHAAKADRDGDVSMGAAPKPTGGVTKTKPASAGRGGKGGKGTSARLPKGSAQGGLLADRIQGAVLRHAAGGAAGVRDRNSRDSVEIKVTGWDKSKVNGAADGGISSLIKWMEKRASQKLGTRKSDVRISKNRIEDDVLYVTVKPSDAGALVRLSGYAWAGSKLKFERSGSEPSEVSVSTADTKAMLRGVLERRYQADAKLLDLSALGADEELQAQHVFNAKSTTSKIFPALMKVLEMCFDTEEERHSAIESVSLANNDLPDLTMVASLSQTLPKLLNLDLSNNKFEKLSSLHSWRKRFYHLRHLVLSGNPLEQNEPDFPAEIIKWYPNLRVLNSFQVRTEEEIASRSSNVIFPFPVAAPIFQDEGGVAENFVRTFVAGYDTDRATLVNMYYDSESTFSMSVNTGALKDPAASTSTEKQEWEAYLPKSRNLKKITHLPARQNRLFKGNQQISDAFVSLPASKHADLAGEANKWQIEAHIQPGVPDPSGQSPTGVDGLLVTLHGEFDEVGNAHKKRSFDRVFVLGPGGPSGVRIVNDMLTIRAYGGFQAFQSEETSRPASASASAAGPAGELQLPPGLTIEQAEQMVLEMQRQTGMTVHYAKDCLVQVGWLFEKGLETFASVRATLPPAAFTAPA